MIKKLTSLIEQLTELKSAIGKLFKKGSKKEPSLPQSIVHGDQTNNNVEGNQTNIINNITAVITTPEDLAKFVGGNPRGMEMFEQKSQDRLPLKIVNKDNQIPHTLPAKKIVKKDAE